MKKIHTTWFDIHSLWEYLYFQDYRHELSSYYRYSIANGVENIDRTTFLTQKFWPYFELILPCLEDENEKVIRQKNWGIITCWFKNFYFQWFSSEWKFLKKREDIWFASIYGFDIDNNNNIWYLIPTYDYVWVFSLEKNIEIFPFENYKFTWYFSMPENIIIYDDYAYISDMWNKRIMRMNIITFELEEYLNFDESVWEYIQCNDMEIVRLESGIYLL